MTNLLLKSYKFNPTTIAFLDGIFVSAAINILTGMGSIDNNGKWISLASAITMMIGAILLLAWQNAANKLQKSYDEWIKPIKDRNKRANDSNHQEPTDWITFIKICNLPFVMHKSKSLILNLEKKNQEMSALNDKIIRKLKKPYNYWAENVNKLNQSIVDKNNKLSSDWSRFVQECKVYVKETSDTEIPELPHYSIKRLITFSVFCCLSLLVSVGLMIWSFI